MTTRIAQVQNFFGLDNVAEPERLRSGWLREASNVDVTCHGAIQRRDGYELVMSGSFTGAYATVSQGVNRMYVVDGGALKQLHADMTATILATGMADAPMFWAEVNNATYFSNGPDKGIIREDGAVLLWDWPTPDTPTLTQVPGSMPPGHYSVACTYTLPDGRETGASDVAYLYLDTHGGLLVADIPQLPGLRTNVYLGSANSTVLRRAVTTSLDAITWDASPDMLAEELLTLNLDPVPIGATVLAAWRGCL